MKTTGEVVQIIQGAIDAKRPFSMVRIGDGESRLLNWPDITPDRDLVLPLDRWFGVQKMEPTLLGSLRDQLFAACELADLLGVADQLHRSRNIYWELIESSLASIDVPRISMNIHIDLQQQRWSFLQNLPWVGTVNCHDVSSVLTETYNVGEVVWHCIPREFSEKQGIYSDLHVSIDPPFTGAVYLVGAGLLGKLVCHWIKERGGIALDIGSIFDLWAGEESRGYMKEFGFV